MMIVIGKRRLKAALSIRATPDNRIVVEQQLDTRRPSTKPVTIQFDDKHEAIAFLREMQRWHGGVKPTINVSARRWFDGENTYHSVHVRAPGVDVIKPFTYGYGDHFMHTAGEILKEAKYDLACGYDLHRVWAEKHGFDLVADVTTVRERADLHLSGRDVDA